MGSRERTNWQSAIVGAILRERERDATAARFLKMKEGRKVGTGMSIGSKYVEGSVGEAKRREGGLIWADMGWAGERARGQAAS